MEYDNSLQGDHTAMQRVDELLSIYGGESACAANLLCDSHPAEAIAYRIVAPDLSAQDLTYGQLRLESEKFATALQSLGIRPGDRVATLMGKSRELLVTLMGIWRLGAVHVPLFTAFAPSAIALRLIDSGAKAVICDEAQLAKLAPGDDIPAKAPWQVISTGPTVDDVLSFALLLAQAEAGFPTVAMGGDAPIIHIYTSGTTGNPKGVVVPMRALAAYRVYAEYGQGLASDDVFWCAADTGWAYGLFFGVLSSFTTGTTSILLEGSFSPEATMAVLANQGVTNFAAAPTVYRALRSAGATPPGALHLRRASSAGEPLTPEVNEWAEHVLGVTVHDHYGQTEMGMMINNHHHEAVRHPVKAGSMGHAMPGWKAVILDPEHDVELGPNELGRVAMVVPESPLATFTGYYRDEGRTAERFSPCGRWYLTGDVGMVDEDGYFYFSSRDDDLILMAGYRIGPFEVEAAMASHPAVAESAVIAVPDEVRGEVIEAYVVLRDRHIPSQDLAQEIQQWVKTRYAAHAYPREIHFIKIMPKTPSGKIQRFVLKQRRLKELADA